MAHSERQIKKYLMFYSGLFSVKLGSLAPGVSNNKAAKKCALVTASIFNQLPN